MIFHKCGIVKKIREIIFFPINDSVVVGYLYEKIKLAHIKTISNMEIKSIRHPENNRKMSSFPLDK